MRLSVAGEVRARRASTRVDVRDKQVRERGGGGGLLLLGGRGKD